LFTFALDAEKEFVNLRVVVHGPETRISAREVAEGTGDLAAADLGPHTIFVDGAEQTARLYDRSRLRRGHHVAGPAVIMEMDSTTLVLPGHGAEVDRFGNLLIRPDAERTTNHQEKPR